MSTRHCGHGLWPLLVFVLAACSNGSGSLDSEATPPASGGQAGLTIGGTVVGLGGSGLVLQNNGAGNLTVASDGSFAFAATASSGAAYDVKVLTQPTTPAQTCAVANGAGTVASANITNIVVTCTNGPRYTIGGRVTGLSGSGLILTNNGADALTVVGQGAFTFATPLAAGTAYEVKISAQPNGRESCVVRNPAGTVASANITNIEVTCAANQFSVSGAVTGLAGTGLVLQLNAANDLAVPPSGAFTFPVWLAPGAPYAVTVKNPQPTNPTQNCVVTGGGSGTIVDANISGVSVACTTSSFAINAAVSGLVGKELTLQLNGRNDLKINANGTFAFPNAVLSGASYAVTVKDGGQPQGPSQECKVDPVKSTGTVGAEAVTVPITCATRSFALNVNVVGLAGTGLRLLNNGVDPLAIPSIGSYPFPTKLLDGSPYAVTIAAQPATPSQQCDPPAAGTINGRDRDVVVNCRTLTFSIGGAVTRLLGQGLELILNDTERLPVNGNGTFTFPRPIASGSSYAVKVNTQPRSPRQSCTIAPGTEAGTVVAADIGSVAVDCETLGYTIGGNVKGLRGNGLKVQNLNGEELAVAANGHFEFVTPMPTGSMYWITFTAQPIDPDPSHFCFLSNLGAGAGFVGTSDVTDIEITCQ